MLKMSAWKIFASRSVGRTVERQLNRERSTPRRVHSSTRSANRKRPAQPEPAPPPRRSSVTARAWVEITLDLDPVVAADDAVDQKHHRVAAVGAAGQFREGCREVWRDAADAAGVEFGDCFDRGFGKWHDACRGWYLSAIDQPATPFEEPRRHPLDASFERRHPVDRLKPTGTEKGQRAVAVPRLKQDCQ